MACCDVQNAAMKNPIAILFGLLQAFPACRRLPLQHLRNSDIYDVGCMVCFVSPACCSLCLDRSAHSINGASMFRSQKVSRSMLSPTARIVCGVEKLGSLNIRRNEPSGQHKRQSTNSPCFIASRPVTPFIARYNAYHLSDCVIFALSLSAGLYLSN